MCGIAGFIAAPGAVDAGAPALSVMLAALVHRGPDGEGRLIHGRFHLGMRRLAVIDLITGDQPLWSDCGRYAVFMNGEIYNYREVKAELEGRGRRFKTKSDTEVVANLFAEAGVAGLARLNAARRSCPPRWGILRSVSTMAGSSRAKARIAPSPSSASTTA